MDHIEIINKIIEAEHSAQEMVDEARKRQVDLDKDLAVECEKIRKTYEDRAERRLDIVRRQEAENTKTVTDALDLKCRQAMDATDKLVEQNFKLWVDSLFSRVIAG